MAMVGATGLVGSLAARRLDCFASLAMTDKAVSFAHAVRRLQIGADIV
ncbi:MAG TPA: hypothetical protein VEA60_07030 [Allosphingosinicella sp.]|nr:hypothetical protein [Allosphingosinicella sp.]